MWNVLSQGIHMCNKTSLSLLNWKKWRSLKFLFMHRAYARAMILGHRTYLSRLIKNLIGCLAVSMMNIYSCSHIWHLRNQDNLRGLHCIHISFPMSGCQTSQNKWNDEILHHHQQSSWHDFYIWPCSCNVSERGYTVYLPVFQCLNARQATVYIPGCNSTSHPTKLLAFLRLLATERLYRDAFPSSLFSSTAISRSTKGSVVLLSPLKYYISIKFFLPHGFRLN